jgi:hypothetical protein
VRIGPRTWRQGLALALAALFAGETSAWGQAAPADAVKAAFIAKFGAFVQWPGPAKSSFAVCVLGDDGVAENLAGLHASRSAPVAIQRLKHIDGEARCDILYVGMQDPLAAEAAMAAVDGRPVLTVTDGATARGIIDFSVRDRRVRFHIDARKAAQNGLTINSKLLSLAESVRR